MLIPITFAPSSTEPKLPSGLAKISHDEVVLIELQGSLDVECNHPSERNGKLVGKLKIDEATNKPTLLIGHHLLEGKITTLVKPLAILRRSNTAVKQGGVIGTAQTDDAMQCDSTPECESEESRTDWNVVGVVKKKIVFSKRPMPIVGRQMAPFTQ